MNLFKFTAHRPWPLPEGPWIMKQSWLDLLFAHWAVRYDQLRELVPSGLELDTYDGYAWIGIVPFRMDFIRLRGLPSIPYTKAFAELNVRTYVTVGDKPGVYFFSLDAANRLAVMMARKFFHLPYYLAGMKISEQSDVYHYVSVRKDRRGASAVFEGAYSPVSSVFHSASHTFEHWLTERYCLYSVDNKRNIWRGEIHHLPWPLQKAEAEISTNTMASGQGIELMNDKPFLHFSKRLDVLIWPIRKAID